MKPFRNENEFAGYPYNLEDTIKGYSDSPMENSPYGTVFQINRGRDVERKFHKILKLLKR